MTGGFDPQTVLIDWKDATGFTIADAQTGVAIFGATGSGKTSGPGALLARAYLRAGFGGLVLCAKVEERAQWEAWAKQSGRSDDLVIVDAAGAARFNFLDWEASRADDGAGFSINVVALPSPTPRLLVSHSGTIPTGRRKAPAGASCGRLRPPLPMTPMRGGISRNAGRISSRIFRRFLTAPAPSLH
jgi:hypothetical protein